MDSTEKIAIRRETLEWRDKWIAKICGRFGKRLRATLHRPLF